MKGTVTWLPLGVVKLPGCVRLVGQEQRVRLGRGRVGAGAGVRQGWG